MNRRAQLAVGLAGVAAAGGAFAAWYACPCAKLPVEGELARLAVGLSFVAAGLAAASQLGNGRMAWLLAAAGLAWFMWDLSWIYQPLPYTLGTALGGVFQPVLGHVAVAFPTGRLRTRLDRFAVIAGYVGWFAFSLATQMVWDPRVDCPAGCTANLLLIDDDRALHDRFESIGIVVGVLVTLLDIGLVVYHWLSASLPAKRALAPVLWSSWPLAGVTIAYTLEGRAGMSPLAPLALMALPIGFSIGLLRMHLTRAAVGRLVIELGESSPSGKLRDVLARALRDPALEVLYWRRERAAYVDLNGRTIELPAHGSRRAATVLQGQHEPVAAIVHDAALQEDPELVRAAGAAARLAIDNERLQAEIRAQLKEVRESRARIVEAEDAARRRLERDLHDGSQQRLVTLALQLSLLEARLGSTPDAEIKQLVGEATRELQHAMAELRELARGIHPAILSDAGLGPALAALAERAPLPVTITELPSQRLPTAVEAAAYFVVAEALTNTAKHARATSVRVSAAQVDGHVRVEVADDGVGGADLLGGSGLQGLADRVGALDGRLDVNSPPGGGTRVLAEIPCPR